MAYWNPRQLLDVYPQQSGFTCVGTTREGRRCRQSFLKNIHKAEADRLLDLLPPPEQFSSNSSQLFPTLRHLAWLTLCPRWHQNGPRCQADAVAAKWLRTITASVPNPVTHVRYQAPVFLPLSPPESPLPHLQTIGRVAPPSQAHNSHSAILLPSPPLSPTQHPPRISAQQPAEASTTPNNPPQVSSSIQTTTRDRSIRIDLNVTIVLDQSERSNDTRRTSNSPVASSSASNSSSRSPALSNASISNQASPRSRSTSSSTNNQAIAYRDVQSILERLESLERQASQIINRGRSASSRSSRSSSSRTSNRTPTHPRSPIRSTISDLYLPPPIGQPELFYSPTRSPPPTPHAGSLSISSYSEPASPVVTFNTPSSSGSSTPSLPPPPGPPNVPAISAILGGLVLAAPLPASAPAGVQRRPITAGTECNICLERIYSPTDAVWCRGTCGQNLHIECFDSWRSYRNEGILLCIYCRQPWVF